VLDTNPPVIAETAANVHAAAEALDALAILALQEGQPVGAICHGGTVAGVFRELSASTSPVANPARRPYRATMTDASAYAPEGGWGSTAEEVVRRWRELGTPLEVAGAGTCVWRAGEGEPVVLLHGVPASSFLYRKVIPRLARHGLAAVALDFPGLGLAERTATLDVSWTGLSAWLLAALDALGIDRFHLVVHDIGGPIGFDLIRRVPARLRSLLVLNTLVHAASFQKPWVMRPFGVRGLGRAYLATVTPWVTERLMRVQGVATPVPSAELRAYSLLLKHEDRGATFLRIMRSFETTADMERRILDTLKARRFPARVLWGKDDPALKIDRFGEAASQAVGAELERVPGKHFVPEDAPDAIADAVAALARTANGVSA
jgi:pimeloyl-ACP methyl ester carboxylesterase